MHPGKVDDAVVLPGVHDETRPERAELDEAAEQLRIRAGPVEPADVVPDVEHARQAHVEPLGQIEPKGLPGGLVVAGPGLGIAPQAGRPAPRDGIGPLPGRVGGLRLVGELGHEKRLRRSRQDLRERTPVAVADGVLVPDLVFVVVVPDGDDAVVEQCRLDAIPPPGAPVGVREVDMEAQAVPELRHGRLARRAVLDEDPLLHRLVEAGMVVQKAGLEIGDRLHPGFLQAAHGGAGSGNLSRFQLKA